MLWWGLGEEASFLQGKKRNSFPKKILPNLYDDVSDRSFAALVTVRAIGAPDRCRLGKAGGS